AQQGTFGDRIFVQVETVDLRRVGRDRVLNGRDSDVMHRLDGLQAKTLLQRGDTLRTTRKQLLTQRRQVDRLGIPLEQGTPVGLVGYLATQQIFDKARLLTGRYAHDRQGLAGALVDPARRHLASPGNTHLHTTGVSQVDDMIGHAELLTPGRLATGAGLIVAFFRAHDAQVTLRQLLHAGIAITLAVAALGLAPTMAAVDGAQVFQAYGFTQQAVQ